MGGIRHRVIKKNHTALGNFGLAPAKGVFVEEMGAAASVSVVVERSVMVENTPVSPITQQEAR